MSEGGLSPIKRAYLKLDELQARVDAAERQHREPVAVVGVGCRFPGGADGPATFWHNLIAGHDAVTEIPPGRWDPQAFYDPTPGTPGKMFTLAGAFIDNVDAFDPTFFGISPREAEGLDPQQRLLLEVVWESLENAGISPSALYGSATGVFMGIGGTDYGNIQLRLDDPALIDAYYASGNAHSVAAGRIAYALGLMGPALSIDTACSSSLVAVHQACQSLRRRECSTALAGGVNLILSPVSNIAFSQASMLSADGRCKTFDAGANGFVHGEGCGVVVLKRLSDAIADGDRIDGVIRGSAINHDGPSTGLTVPNGSAQASVIRAALQDAGVEPTDVGYVEAHGTGTSLGDPIEVHALGATLGAGREKTNPLLIGSVKTNVGHLAASSGVAGLIKVILSLKAGELPKHLHFEEPNPHIQWDRFPVRVVTERTAFPAGSVGPIAGVSAFGFSGTNAHVIVAAPPPTTASAASLPPLPVTLSARSAGALREQADRYAAHLEATPDIDLGSVAYTANVGRAHMKHRLVATADTGAELQAALAAFARDAGHDGAIRSHVLDGPDAPGVAFLFTGQGAQYANMGRDLYRSAPAFRDALDRCDEIVRPHWGRSLISVMHPESSPDPAWDLDRTAVTQPALFALEYALSEMWRSWGIEPRAVMGYSLGEIVAACVSGILDLESALTLVVERGRLMQSLPSDGAMAAVFAAPEQVMEAVAPFADTVAIAGFNGPANVVISGRREDLERILAVLRADGVEYRELAVSHAFHSPLMDPVLERFQAVADGLAYAPPQLDIVSNLTGTWVPGNETLDGSYWRRHAREAVRFEDSLKTLSGVPIFLEVGPKPTLIGMGARCLDRDDRAWIPSLRPGVGDWQQVTESLGSLHLLGAPVAWRQVHAESGRCRLELPTYPFERTRYWVPGAEWKESAYAPPRASVGHPFLGREIDTPLNARVFESRLSAETVPLLYQHVVRDTAIVPGAAVLDSFTAGGRRVCESEHVVISEVALMEAIVLPPPGGSSVAQLVFEPVDAGTWSARLFTRTGDGEPWRLHASGRVSAQTDEAGPSPESAAIHTIRARCDQTVGSEDFYECFRASGLRFGPSFQCLTGVDRTDGEALGELRAPETDETIRDAGRYGTDPAILDGCLQVISAALPGFDVATPAPHLFMPFEIERTAIPPHTRPARYSHAVVDRTPGRAPETVTAHVSVLDADGNVLAQVRGMLLKQVDAAAFRDTAPLEQCYFDVAWRPLPPAVGSAASRAPDPVDVAGSIAHRLPDLVEETGIGVYGAMDRDLDALCGAYVRQALRRLGWAFGAGASITGPELMLTLGIEPRHGRLVDRFLGFLAEDGFLRESNGRWDVVAPIEAEACEKLYHGLLGRYSKCDAEIRWTSQTGTRLADVLAGAANPLDLLFPRGDTTIATRVYGSTPAARMFNTLAGEALEEMAGHCSEAHPLRILEVGAGTGATTEAVLQKLPSGRFEYTFTDIGPTFVGKAQDRFADHPGMAFGVLDIERAPADQGFPAEAFDVVVASNVLHATRDLRAALGNVGSVLAPGGVLLLLEATAPQRWFDVTVGLTEGWWRFDDADVRPDYALLDESAWHRLLLTSGFESATTVAGTGPGASADRQALILGRRTLQSGPGVAADGAVRDEHWLIFSDGAYGSALADHLGNLGIGCQVVLPSTDGSFSYGQESRVDPMQPAHFQDLLAAAGDGAERALRVVYLWPLAAHSWSDPTVETLDAALAGLCGGALHLVRALIGTPSVDQVRLCLVTKGARPVESPVEAPHQAALWGFGKGLLAEHPELEPLLVDLDPEGVPDGSAIQRLIDEITHGAPEAEVAFRQGRRLGARLTRSGGRSSDPGGPATSRSVWTKPETGLLEDLRQETQSIRPPGANDVQIEVAAAALNFRDVLVALDVHHDFDSIGSECAGRVTALGTDVRDLEVGDEVIAIAPTSLASHVTANRHLVCRKPTTVPFPEAASLPIAFLTADHALTEVGRMRAKDKVLIHAAAGGVGMAAVQLARKAGARVFATAGSERKREALRELGVEQVWDSRSLDFAEEVMRVTGGSGVDIVLNALAGPHVERGLSILSPGGRFLELGKSDVWTESRARGVNPQAEYHAVDLTGDIKDRPESIAPRLARLVERVSDGDIEPLPCRTFDFDDAVAAFRYMEQARHIGKIALVRPSVVRPRAPLVVGTASYLVTGGLSGLGLLVAEWLVEQGARHLVLAGRRPPSEEAANRIAGLEADGAEVVVSRTDVSSESAVAALARRLESMPPLRGVIHSAGVLDDGVVAQQTWDRFATVLAPKTRGTLLLKQAFGHLDLDFFALFSSVASVIGGKAATNHAAANAFLDSVASHLRTEGIPAISINWGAWSETGAAVREQSTRIADRGLQFITPSEGLLALEEALRRRPDQMVVVRADWESLLTGGVHGRQPFFDELVILPRSDVGSRGELESGNGSNGQALLDVLEAAFPDERRALLTAHVEDAAARVLRLQPGVIDRNQPLSELGLDSLMAVELRNSLRASVGRPLPATLLFDFPTVQTLSDHLAFSVLGLEEGQRHADREERAATPDLLEMIEALSDEEVDQLLGGSEGGH